MTRRRRRAVGVESYVAPLFPVPPQPRHLWPTHNLARELTDLAAKQRSGGDGATVRKLPAVTSAAFVSATSPVPYWIGLALLVIGCALWTWAGERR